MYVARQHQMSEEHALAFARGIGIGQWVSQRADGELNATLAPFVIVERDGKYFLQAHFARVNTQWQDLGPAMVIVSGPVAHVSGTDFPPEKEGQRMPTVPTLNYVTVHFRGRLSAHDNSVWKRAHLESLIEQFEGEWRIGTHSSYELVEHAFVAMVGVELEVSEIIGKAKLGQNLSPADLAYTASHLRAHGGGEVADLMEEIALPWAEARDDRVEDARSAGKSTLPYAGGLAT